MYVLLSGMVWAREIAAVFPDQATLYMYIVQKLFPNSRLSRISGASAGLFGSMSVAGKDSISRLENDCKFARTGPFAAMTSALGIAKQPCIVWVLPVITINVM